MGLEKEDIVDFSSDESYNMDVFAPTTEAPEVKTSEEIAILAEAVEAERVAALTPEQVAAEKIEKDKLISEPNTDGLTPEQKLEAERVAKIKKDASDDKGGTSPNSYSSFASVLHEEGIISSLSSDVKIESASDLIKVLNDEVTSREFAELNETQKEYLTALRKGIPEADIKEYQKVTDQLASITTEEISNNAELRVALITQDFQNKGMTAERAAVFAKRSVDTGDDVADATEAYNALKVSSKAEFDAKVLNADKLALEAADKTKNSLAALKKEITGKTEIIPSMKMSEVLKLKLYDQMTKSVGVIDGKPINAVQKKRLDDPMAFEIKMNYLFQITNGFEDFSKLVINAKSAAAIELEKALQGQGAGGLGGGGNVQHATPIEGDNAFQGIGELA